MAARPPLPRRNLYAAWIVAAAIITILGVVKIATHEPNGAGYLGVAAVIVFVVADRVKRQLRRQMYGPTRAELAADRLHRRIFGSRAENRED